MMSSNIKRTRAARVVYSCCLVFSEEALERLSPYAEQVASRGGFRHVSLGLARDTLFYHLAIAAKLPIPQAG